MAFSILIIANGFANAQGASNKTGLNALITPENSVLLLIDHQPFQFAGLGSHDPQTILNNTIIIAKTAKLFKVPTLLTTVLEERGGYLVKGVQDVFPDQKPLDRTWINAWQDKKVVDWVKKQGRKKVIIAGLWTEICVAMPAIQALSEGYEVFVIADACGGNTKESHDRAMDRMVQAGVIPITAGVLTGELQRDWARTETVPGLAAILAEHGGNVGIAYAWEVQLLNSSQQNKK
ncbi:hydrolase [Niastella populi]|uniref:Hydrolase n=2 Tax=Niastella populi TaxID=550983 RepID=A0A1V9FVB2_9BACT|nr:hydrolase [Niastella populi]